MNERRLVHTSLFFLHFRQFGEASQAARKNENRLRVPGFPKGAQTCQQRGYLSS